MEAMKDGLYIAKCDIYDEELSATKDKLFSEGLVYTVKDGVVKDNNYNDVDVSSWDESFRGKFEYQENQGTDTANTEEDSLVGSMFSIIEKLSNPKFEVDIVEIPYGNNIKLKEYLKEGYQPLASLNGKVKLFNRKVSNDIGVECPCPKCKEKRENAKENGNAK